VALRDLWGLAVFVARPAARSRPRMCAFGVWCHRSGLSALAAGATWALVVDDAPWAGRISHSSAIDAAGAIYVIGGYELVNGDVTIFQDVWASTDGGADRTRPGQWSGGTFWVPRRVLRGDWGQWEGSQGIHAKATRGVLGGCNGYSQSTSGTKVYQGVPRGT
jgi:hypothetical protein